MDHAGSKTARTGPQSPIGIAENGRTNALQLRRTNTTAIALLSSFCSFLSNRVKTKNLPLMKRMVGDYFSDEQNATTLEEFVEFGGNLIAVLPVEISDCSQRAFASNCLITTGGVDTTATHRVTQADVDDAISFLAMLEERVDTRNLDFLETFFREFIQHRETAIQAFVANGCCAVSIIPSANLCGTGEVLLAAMGSHLCMTKICDPRNTTLTLENRQLPRFMVNPPECEFDDEFWTVLHCRATNTDIDGMRDEVIAELEVIISREPWRVAYGNLPLPFDENEAPALAFKLRSFWRNNARAVWERYFWSPLKESHPTFQARKNRQRTAVTQFNEVFEEAYQTLGTQFFVQLDQMPYDGWWYRRPVLRVVQLRHKLGRRRCSEILEQAAVQTRPFRYLFLPLSETQQVPREHSSRSRAVWSKSWNNFNKVMREMKHIYDCDVRQPATED